MTLGHCDITCFLQRWWNFWKTGWSAYGLYWAHRYHLELNCEKTWNLKKERNEACGLRDIHGTELFCVDRCMSSWQWKPLKRTLSEPSRSCWRPFHALRRRTGQSIWMNGRLANVVFITLHYCWVLGFVPTQEFFSVQIESTLKVRSRVSVCEFVLYVLNFDNMFLSCKALWVSESSL